MHFGYLGINYKTASLAVRDHISFTENTKIDFLQKAEQNGISQCVILATCNRSEVFFFYEANEQLTCMRKTYIGTFPEVDFEEILLVKTDEEAMDYLFRIAAGLESAVLGEDQILGQLKDALMLSRAMGFCKKEMNRVIENAMSTAKSIKTTYRVSEIPLSVSYIGIKEVQKRTGFQGKDVMIVGSGATAVLALQYIVPEQPHSITLCSRNPLHAKSVQEKFSGIRIVSYEERYQYLTQSDVVISATSSPHFAIRGENCKIERETLFLDLAAPRDVDPALAENPLVTIINLDFLNEIAKDNQRERERLTNLCHGEIDKAVEETLTWLFESRVDATISSLNQRCDEITEESFEYLNRKLDLSEREQKILKKILKASLKKLVREPILELKSLDSVESQEIYTKLINDMFHL